MSYLTLLLVLSLVVYRVARFIVLDTLIEGTRQRVLSWLDRPGKDEVRPPLWREKLGELLTCPFCCTIWVAAGAVLATRVFVGSFPTPVWLWLASATGAVIVWRIVDFEED